MIRFALAAAALAVLAPAALGQPMPMPKSGQCPSGYRESDGYCAPTSERAPVAVPKVPGRQCPSGFASEANYCVEITRR
jgi:hypothetical protein